MTEEEILQEILAEFEAMLTARNIAVRWTMAIGLDTSSMTMYSGNTCPICAINHAVQWALANNIMHTHTMPGETLN